MEDNYTQGSGYHKQRGVLVCTGNKGLAKDTFVKTSHLLINEPCKVPRMLGIPLWAAIEQRGQKTNNLVTRLMIERDDGFAPLEWYIGCKDANDIVLGRSDGKDFTLNEYLEL